ncbi:MAG TPA: tetratricopeptide repeat protein [Blastocatellia bacterium]|nr:tetratricopeptide repeat protein [Blastocatellia bacterium]
MKTSEPNNSMPPSPDDSGLPDDPSPSNLPCSARSRLVVREQFAVSPGSQMQLAHPQVQYSPPNVECPASTTDWNGWAERGVFGTAGISTISNTTAQKQSGSLNRLIDLSPLENVGATRLKASFRADVLVRALATVKTVTEITPRLIRLADLAHGRRDLEMLADLSAVLYGLPGGEAQSAGLYYQAILLRRAGKYEASKRLLEQLSAKAPPATQARALQTLGTVYEAQAQWGEAARLYTEAVRAARGVDALAAYRALGQLAIIKSIAGDHRRALADFQSLWPIARLLTPQHPDLFFHFHNSLAVELAAVGQIDEAREASRIALASPVAHAYPEWQETAAEIAEQQSSKAIIVVARPQDVPDESEERPRPLIFSEPPTPVRLPLAPPPPTTAHLLTCAPIRAPTA